MEGVLEEGVLKGVVEGGVCHQPCCEFAALSSVSPVWRRTHLQPRGWGWRRQGQELGRIQPTADLYLQLMLPG